VKGGAEPDSKRGHGRVSDGQEVRSGDSSAVRPIAFYLPQFHPTPENDGWWGKGFTEWRNVVQGRPLFRGHYQPHLPADLGFYDLRLPEAREAQAELARRHGIHGFCYYHYWFNERRLLGRPFEEVLASGRPDFPFCLCWANEDWTRAWDGRSGEHLIRQQYSEEDDRQHIRWLAQAFRDERYIKVGGRPLFLVYRATLLPDPRRTTDVWRGEAQRLGIGDLFLCRVESFGDERGDPADFGFDAAVEFQPDWSHLGTPLRRQRPWRLARKLGWSDQAYRENRIFEYVSVVRRMSRRGRPAYRRFPCVTPGWDNTPRRKSDAVILKNSTPNLYEAWLRAAIDQSEMDPPDERLVFINAWNEWAEGNHLEPCRRWGRAYLDATLKCVRWGPTVPSSGEDVLSPSGPGR
jgi:lipopolysaccharide biosynthesis protein